LIALFSLKTSGLKGQEVAFTGRDSRGKPKVNPSDSTALSPKIKFIFGNKFLVK
jgi:hypothetical protein